MTHAVSHYEALPEISRFPCGAWGIRRPARPACRAGTPTAGGEKRTGVDLLPVVEEHVASAVLRERAKQQPTFLATQQQIGTEQQHGVDAGIACDTRPAL